MSRALQLVAALEEASRREVDVLDMASLVEILEERRPLLDELEAVDLTKVPEDVRTALRSRLSRLYDEDRSLLSRLRARKSATGVALAQLREARRAAQGYRRASARSTGVVLTRA
ncbi:MAG: hypothetical protein ACFCGT_19595 [Sandaracinaceae bacterium]